MTRAPRRLTACAAGLLGLAVAVSVAAPAGAAPGAGPVAAPRTDPIAAPAVRPDDGPAAPRRLQALRPTTSGVDVTVRPPARRVPRAASNPPQLVYSVLRLTGQGTESSAVARLDPLSGTARNVATASNVFLSVEAWSARLFRIFYFASDEVETDLFSVSQAGGPPRREVADAESSDVSRDGQRIVFTRTEGQVENLFVVDRPGAAPRRLTGAGGFIPRFSPDGSRIVFSRYLPAPGGEQADLFTVRTDGTGLTRVTARVDREDVLAAFSPDGRRVVFSRGTIDGDATAYDVYSAGLDGTGLRLVRAGAVAPDWAANGWLTYVRLTRPEDTGQVAVRSPGVPGRERVLTRETNFLSAVRFAR